MGAGSKFGAAAVVAATVSAGTVAVSPPASAALYPSGCNSWATFAPLSDNCWLGKSSSYINSNAGFIYGIQWAIGAADPNGAVYTSDFTAGVEKLVGAYQQSEGLGVDGIVGTNTWGHLHSDLLGQNCGNGFFSPPGHSCSDPAIFYLRSSTVRFWVRAINRNGTPAAHTWHSFASVDQIDYS